MISSNTDNYTNSSRKLCRVSTLLYNELWALKPDKFDVMCDAFEGAVENLAAMPVPKSNGTIDLDIVGSTAVIDVSGVISKRMNMLQDISGGTSIQILDSQFDEAMAREDVNSIVFNIDSPGGAVNGTAEFASKLYEAAQDSEKVIVAFADGMAASAAYWIGSQCNEFHASEAAEVGSIGVLAKVFDNTRKLKNEGVDPVVIRSSELKAPGVGPLTNKQADAIAKNVDSMYSMFKSAVERGRPGINIDSVATGETFIGRDAVDNGLVDSISTLEKVIDKLQ
jgi:signal peptide peptidase SppA